MHYLPHQIKDVALQAIEALGPAFERSLFQYAGEWLQRCEQDQAQLWRDGDLWAVTEVQELKTGRALHIVAMAGAYTPRLMEEMEAWGRHVGCRDAFFSGRRGWARRLPDYKIESVTMQKGLQPCHNSYRSHP